MKRMKRAVSVLTAACLLAGSGYTGGVKTEVSISPIVQAEDIVSLNGEDLDSLQEEKFSWLDGLRTSFKRISSLGQRNIRTASAEEKEEEEYRYVLRYNDLIIENNDSQLPRMSVSPYSKTISLTCLKVGTDEIGSMASVKSYFEVVGENQDVLTITNPKDESANYFNVTANKPGWADVHGQIWKTDENGNIISDSMVDFYVTFLVTAELDQTDTTVWKVIDKEKDKFLVLDPTTLTNGTYQLVFDGMDDPNKISESIKFSKPSPDIITITENGLIEVVGAGMTTITVKNFAKITIDGMESNVSAGDPYEITVVVLPTGGYQTDDVAKFGKEVNVHITKDTEDPDEFLLHTNAVAAGRLSWKVYAVKENGTKELLDPEKSSLLNYTLEEGNIRFTNVKAGTYLVEGYVSEEYSEQLRCLKFNVVVDLIFDASDTIYMNVDDTYNITENSNIPDGMFDKLFVVLPVDESGNAVGTPTVATMNGNTGVVTAHSFGTQRFVVSYRPGNASDGIFSKEVKENLTPYNYTFEVIDKLSLNYSSLTMMTGQTMQLIPNQTQAGIVEWYVSDEDKKYITIDEKNGIITAVNVTPKNYTATVMATQIIDGVKKTATCKITVQQAVSEIVLAPSELTLAIGEVKSIEAIISPEGLASYNISWESSNEKVFTCESTSPTTVQVTAVAAGTAVLTAISTDNIVVGYATITVKQSAAGITLSEPKIEGMIGGIHYLYATVTPADATNKGVIWESYPKGIVEVDAKGKVTFKKAGTATIVASLEDDPTIKAECEVTVKQTVSGLTIDLSSSSIVMYVGETTKIDYTVSPAGASNPSVEWTSFNESVVSVDGNGKLSAKAPGTTQIMVMSKENSSYYQLCTVVVKQQATSVRMNYTEVTLNRGEYFDMEVTITPATSTETDLTWESLNTSVVTVSTTGRFTARAVGEALVLVKTANGVTSYCTVTVVEPVTGLTLDPGDVTIDVGEKFTIAPVFTPANPTNVDVNWTSSNTSIATINAAGELEGKARGTTIITCESVDGGYRAFCMVTVADPELELVIDPDTYRLGYGKTYNLTAILKSRGVEQEADVEWSSSNSSVCSVDKNGKIKGLNYGYATITAVTNDEYEVMATCEVRVVREVTSIRLNYTYVEVIQGQTVNLRATVNPSNASYTDVIFSSENSDIAVIDEDGTITGLQPGEIKIQAYAKDNSGKTASCYVKVIAPIAATGITVSDKQIVLVPGEKKQITTSVKPNNSTDAQMWSSGNEYIATVDGTGTITAHTTGTTTVTVMTSSGKTATIEVVVLGLSRTTLELPIYTKYSKLTVDGATTTVRWDVEDSSICEVSNGVITARKVGTTKVSATINGRTLTCTVKVTGNKK